jgi:hypothetical protein
MTFLDKLADCISGGKISYYKEVLSSLQNESHALSSALQEIISRDTPKAAPAAKRAADIARKALGQ